ncbi:AAA family ATPase [Roseinatronobacter monicus]|uniref:Putative AbiEii toxin of type IV toxin-antitoxin system n=1 Tax=Roseinatronobacter monicus TaxID=393481 RepID=A0A543KBG4_9RHOB|nr:AAA family ATPase [Roseinatronobacter monicus]TQM92404.1 putative AbiEii toxin of type IV toxin-antitoxin system [Roseinatronobacter monicus]
MDFTNIDKKIAKLAAYDVATFDNMSNSFKHFALELKVHRFRHLTDIILAFDHPVTVLAGTNKIGKTSILLLLACSHEKFMRLDASKPEPTWREHAWKDVLTFTKHETEKNDYTYSMKWRIANKSLNGEGKRLASSKSWSGLGKKSKEARRNAKINDREVRLIDLDRLLPARSFSASLLRKSGSAPLTKMSDDLVKSFCYVLDLPYNNNFEISEVGGHVNKRCYLIKSSAHSYSSYGAASGEEALINLLRDILDAPDGSLILIDEIEAGFHPAVQRKLVKVICQIAWEQKKQFIMTSHSSTIIDATPAKSRKFIEHHNGLYRTISGIAPQAALSKMDSIGHPLVRLFCEDDLAEYLITMVATEISKEHKNFRRLFEVIRSGPANMVKTDYERHKFFFNQLRNKIGYCAVFDGDHHNKPGFKELGDADKFVHFLKPYTAPEVALAQAYLASYPNAELQAFLGADNHHAFFQKMVDMDLAVDKADARNNCYSAFKASAEFALHFDSLKEFLMNTATHFSEAKG